MNEHIFVKSVIAVRIYWKMNDVMADLKMNDGVTETIQWTNKRQREEFLPLMNGYTLFYDEREKREWSDL